METKKAKDENFQSHMSKQYIHPVTEDQTIRDDKESGQDREYGDHEEDEDEEDCGPPNPLDSWIGQLFALTYEWMTPSIVKWYLRGPPQMEDVWRLRSKYRARVVVVPLERNWRYYAFKERTSMPLLRALHATFGRRFWLSGLLSLGCSAANIAAPLLTAPLLRNLSNPDASSHDAWVWVAALFLSQIFLSFMANQFFDISGTCGMNVKSATVNMLYRKSLSLSHAARSRRTTGEIVNLMSIDCEKLLQCSMTIPVTFLGATQIIGSLVSLIFLLGPVALIGILFMLLLLPVQILNTRVTSGLRKKIIRITDQRVKLISEILKGIRAVKLFAWEKPFGSMVNKVRSREVRQYKLINLVRTVFQTVTFAAPVTTSVLTFGAYAIMHGGSSLHPSIVFPALGLFRAMRMPLNTIVNGINLAVEGKISLDRLETFFLEEELENDVEPISSSEGVSLEIVDGHFEWDIDIPSGSLRDMHSKKGSQSVVKRFSSLIHQMKHQGLQGLSSADVIQLQEDFDMNEQQTAAISYGLTNINLRVTRGDLVMIIGAIGAGKSSLLSGIIGDMKRVSGVVRMATHGQKLAYCAQNSWILNATLQNNILFGKTYEFDKYERVLDVCAIRHDLGMLPAGDQTEIGERGINVSGGQRQRVAIARAVYSDSDIYLFDDVLSAVDAHIGRHLFEECINGYLKGKTRLLVTHQLHWLPYADHIVVMNEGMIVEQGSYEELMQDSEGVMASLMREHTAIDTAFSLENNGTADINTVELSAPMEHNASSLESEDRSKTKENGRLMQKEERLTGAVSLRTAWDYIMHMGGTPGIVMGVILTTFFIGELTLAGTDWFLSQWSAEAFNFSLFGYLIMYAMLAVIASTLVLGRNLLFTIAGLEASRNLHIHMFDSVMHAPMSFFDTTPLGRIVARFAKDTESADSSVISSLNQAFTLFMGTIMSMVIIGISLWWFLFAIIPLILIIFFVQQLYRTTNREVKRMDSIRRSPLYAHFSESLVGVSTIRAFRCIDRFSNSNARMLDRSVKFYYAQFFCERWLVTRTHIIGAIIVAISGSFAVLMKGQIPAAYAGLALSYSIQIKQVLGRGIRAFTDAEAQMNNIERIVHYGKNLPREHSVRQKVQFQNLNDWPEDGSIVFNKVQMRYRPELPLVLRDIELNIRPGEKIGVVGRTGAGNVVLFNLNLCDCCHLCLSLT